MRGPVQVHSPSSFSLFPFMFSWLIFFNLCFGFGFVDKPLPRIAREPSHFSQGKRVLPIKDDGVDVRDSFPLGETESFIPEVVEPFPIDVSVPVSGIL